MLTKGGGSDIIDDREKSERLFFRLGFMGKIFNSVDELIGGTPLIRLHNFEKYNSIGCEVLAKVELFNPAGSIKDRAALEMIEDAEARGILREGGVIIEPTSGNTGIGLAAICASRGYRLIIVMPDSMSVERQLLMRAYGAELILTDGALGMAGSIAKAEELKGQIEGAIIAGQFSNPANPMAHYKTTAPEILEQCDGEIDIFISCIGTGGTITGCARYLKEKNPAIKVIGVEPASSPFITEGRAGAHAIQGIGAGFIPDNLDLSLIDEVMTVTDGEAVTYMRNAARCEGLLVGVSSGAALAAAMKISRREENEGKRIVVILPDTGERYLSAGIF